MKRKHKNKGKHCRKMGKKLRKTFEKGRIKRQKDKKE